MNNSNCDTVFTLTRDGVLSARYIQHPGPGAVGKRIDRASKDMNVITPDFETITVVKRFSPYGQKDLKRYTLLIDKKTSEIFECKFLLKDVVSPEPEYQGFTDVLNMDNTYVTWIDACDLVDALEEDRILNPELKAIAQTLTDNSNPVLMMIKFKGVVD